MRNEISRKGLFGWLLGAAMLASIALTGSAAQAQDLFSTDPSRSPTADKDKAPPLDVAGTWSGPVHDNKGGDGTFEFNFTQKDYKVGGNFSVAFPDIGVYNDGTLTGTVTSKSLKFKFHPDGTGKSCHGIFASTSATSSSITGKYHFAGCADGNNEKGSTTVSPE